MNIVHRIVIVVVLLSLVLTACAPAATPTTEIASTPAPQHLKVLLLPYLSFAPFFVAQEEGYFADQGLEVEFVQMQQSTDAVAALAQGQLDVIAGFINVGLLNVIANSDDVKLVADQGHQSASNCSSVNFMAAAGRDVQAMLDDPQQRTQLRFSINAASVEGYFIEQALAPYGLKLKDVQLEDIGDPAAEMQALQSGAVDIALTSEPWITRITQTNSGTLWQRISDSSPDFQSGIIAYGPNLLVDNREAGERFMVAYLKGVRQFEQGKTERNLQILAQYTRLEPDLLRASCWNSFTNDGNINAQSIMDFAEWAKTGGLLETAPTLERFWDGAFVEAANQILGATP